MFIGTIGTVGRVAGAGAGAVETTQSLPAMTSNTAPSGYTASASSTFSGNDPYKAFDGVLTGGDQASWGTTTAQPQWLQRVNPTAFRMGAYDITTRSDDIAKPTAWTLYGTNDNGTTLIVLDTQSGQSFGTSETKRYTIPAANRGSFTGHRLTITNSTDGYSGMSELRFFKEL